MFMAAMFLTIFLMGESQAKSLSDSDCMALNIYHEARNQSLHGQLAVGYVVINRVKSKHYPNNICQVIKQPKQFSWYSDGKPDTPFDRLALDIAYRVARYVMVYRFNDITNGATHYHATWMKKYPHWSKKLKKLAVIDNHVFYKR
jgi:spore germination cell wall hydrolase CwlJ-like protein